MKCPYCDEAIQDGASKCRFCKEWIGAREEPARTARQAPQDCTEQDAIIAEFAQQGVSDNPFHFLIELVNNSVEAGATRVNIEFEYQPNKDNKRGVFVLHINDNAKGMTGQEIRTKLTRLLNCSLSECRYRLSSSRIGFGLLSTFALKPKAVFVDTGKDGEYWRIYVKEDRSFDCLVLPRAVEGTQIKWIKELTTEENEFYRSVTLRTLSGAPLTGRNCTFYVDGQPLASAGPAERPPVMPESTYVSHRGPPPVAREASESEDRIEQDSALKIERAQQVVSILLHESEGKSWRFATGDQQPSLKLDGPMIVLRNKAIMQAFNGLAAAVVTASTEDTLSLQPAEPIKTDVQGILSEYYGSAVLAGAVVALGKDEGLLFGSLLYQLLVRNGAPYEQSLLYNLGLDTIQGTLSSGLSSSKVSGAAMQRASKMTEVLARLLNVETDRLLANTVVMSQTHMSLDSLTIDILRKYSIQNRKGCGSVAALFALAGGLAAISLLASSQMPHGRGESRRAVARAMFSAPECSVQQVRSYPKWPDWRASLRGQSPPIAIKLSRRPTYPHIQPIRHIQPPFLL